MVQLLDIAIPANALEDIFWRAGFFLRTPEILTVLAAMGIAAVAVYFVVKQIKKNGKK